MARVTVEDCVDKVPNRFELVLLAAQRSRQIASGGQVTVERDNDKNPVVSLREIAEESVSVSDLREAVIHGMQKHVEVDEPEEDDIAMLLAGSKSSEAHEEMSAATKAGAEIEAELDNDSSDDGDD